MFFYTSVFKKGNYIYFRGIKNGKRINHKVLFQPSLHVLSSNRNTPTKFRSIKGEPLEQIKFSSIKEAQEFVNSYKSIENFPIFGNTNFVYQFISRLFPETIQFDIKQVSLISIDIETTVNYGFPDPRIAAEEVLLITIDNFNTGKLTTFGCTPFETKKQNHQYILCANEKELLSKFIDFLKSDYPDIITGWNVQLFDIAYLSSRIIRVLGEDKLKECSPFQHISTREVPFATGRTQLAYDWSGISTLDFLDLYKKFSYKTVENYKLDTIAKEELGDEKVKHPYSSFKEFYTKDWSLFVDYNAHDAVLVNKLEEKMGLVNLILTMAFDAKCNFTDIYSSVRTWDCILYNYLLKQNIIISNPSPIDESLDRQIMGAYVMEPNPGFYDWVVSFDATSLYPSIIMTWNMSPETLVQGEKYLADEEKSIVSLINREVSLDNLVEKNYTMTANGQCFTRTKKGIFPELIEFYFAARQTAKKAMLKAQDEYEKTKDPKYISQIATLNSKQMAAKILMNSLYGAMGNIHFRYYDIRIAEGITMTGQLIIRSVGKKLNEYINKRCNTNDYVYSFYSDTDSTYFTLGPFVNDQLKDKSKREIVQYIDKFCTEKIEPTINAECKEIGKYLNVHTQKIKFKREVIADRGIWIAKKRYALNVYNAEGVEYTTPKVKVLGMEIVRSSTPPLARTILKTAVNLALTSTEEAFQSFIQDAENEWYTCTPEEISFPRGINGLSKYTDSNSIYKLGTPVHVKGALIYNHYVKEKGIENTHRLIEEGDKIKFVYLSRPNTLNADVITFVDSIPPELNVLRHVDYDKMFEKIILNPLTSLATKIGWSVRQSYTVEDLFA